MSDHYVNGIYRGNIIDDLLTEKKKNVELYKPEFVEDVKNPVKKIPKKQYDIGHDSIEDQMGLGKKK
jgi:hypothetical protein